MGAQAGKIDDLSLLVTRISGTRLAKQNVLERHSVIMIIDSDTDTQDYVMRNYANRNLSQSGFSLLTDVMSIVF